jgi:hypothetical protein
MAKVQPSSSKPRHQVTGKDYPSEWARQVELALDQEQRRLYLYGGLFCAFVLAVVIAAMIGVAIDAPPVG